MWFTQVFSPAARRSPRRAVWPCPSELPFRIFRRGQSSLCPLRAEGEGKGRAFLGGVLSGVVEPIGAVLTILGARLIVPALPYLLSFAAGAMLYVVVEELISEMSQGKHSNLGTLAFAVGFSIMMALDVAL